MMASDDLAVCRSCSGNMVRQALTGEPRYDTVREAACRLTIGVPALHRLINTRVIPVQSVNARRKIAKLVVGQLLASAYEIWLPERRPQYSVEELRKLSGITVEAVAAQLGLGRTAGYEAVRNHEIPARKLPNLDRWIVPEDVVAQMEAYDLGNLPPALLSAEECRLGSPYCEGKDQVTDNEAAGKGECVITGIHEAGSSTKHPKRPGTLAYRKR